MRNVPWGQGREFKIFLLEAFYNNNCVSILCCVCSRNGWSGSSQSGAKGWLACGWTAEARSNTNNWIDGFLWLFNSKKPGSAFTVEQKKRQWPRRQRVLHASYDRVEPREHSRFGESPVMLRASAGFNTVNSTEPPNKDKNENSRCAV